MARPQNSFEPYPDPKNSPLGPWKVKNDPNFKQKSRVKINETLENNRCLTTGVQHEKVFESYPDTKNSPLGPQTVKLGWITTMLQPFWVIFGLTWAICWVF